MVARPTTVRATITEAGVAVPLSGVVEHIQISNDGAIACRLFWSQAEMDANTPYVELAASTGYYEGPDGVAAVYLKLVSAGSQAVTVKYNARPQTTSVA